MINSWLSKDAVWASYRDVKGELIQRRLADAEYVGFIRPKDKDLIGRDASVVDIRPDFPDWLKVVWTDYESRKQAVERNPSLIFEGDVSPVRRFITDHYCKIEPPLRAYLDIETDARVPFSEAIQGNTRLLSFALVGQDGRKLALALEDEADQAEAELWAELWKFLGNYDSCPAWNGDRFDFAVMKERCERLARQYRVLEPYWEHRRRVLLVDQMLCFKRHHMAAESGDEKTSLRLGDVCESLFGEGKNDFDASKTWEAWSAGGSAREELVAYNLQDTLLLPKLEAETGYLELQQAIGQLMLCPVNTHTIQPMPWVDAYLLKMAHRRKTHLKSKLHGDGVHGQIEGAIVMAPTRLGLHENVHVCDFKSLYPTIVRTFNLGSETKLGRQPDGASDLQCLAGNDVYFRTDTESMLAEFCRDMMNFRDQYKQEMKKYPPGTPEWKSAERLSKGAKIANNAGGFGVTGNPYFRLYDPEVTGAIIQGARLMWKATSEAAATEGKETLYGDTDSLFIVGGTVDEFAAFVKRCNETVFPKVLDERGCRKDFRCVELAYEKQFARLIFPLGTKGDPSAKRYAGLYSHYGGKAATTESKPEIRGLEYMRTDSTRRARRMQRTVIEMILRQGIDAEEIEEAIKQWRRDFFDSPIELEDIVLSKGISRDLSLYKVNSPHVRLAKAMAAEGEDVGEGTRISYVVEDARVSPAKVIPAEDFDGTNLDKIYYWKAIYSPTMRVLAGAFPNRPWSRWHAKYPRVKVLPGQLTLM